MNETQHSPFLFADISGFTLYRICELTHSHEILIDLFRTIIEKFKPLMTFSKPESDAGLLL